MIAKGSRLKIIDNSGVKWVECIENYGINALPGNFVLVTAKEVDPASASMKSKLYLALITTTRQRIYEASGDYVTFDENTAVLCDRKAKLLFTRILGPVSKRLSSHHADYKKFPEALNQVLKIALEVI